MGVTFNLPMVLLWFCQFCHLACLWRCSGAGRAGIPEQSAKPVCGQEQDHQAAGTGHSGGTAHSQHTG